MSRKKQLICATPEGLKTAELALKRLYGTKANFAEAKLIGRSTVTNFFLGREITVDKFKEICEHLTLTNWEEIAGLNSSQDSAKLPNDEPPKPDIEPVSQVDIDALVEQMRQKVSADIRKNCGTMKVLDMNQSIGLDDIYTDVNILEKITRNRQPDIEKILEECNIKDFDRFSLNPVREERVAGLEAVERYSKLMIFGKPGAGKTTFLKRIAIQCDSGNFLANHLPIFITLKEFAEDENKNNLLNYICCEHSINDTSEQKNIETILQHGRAVILLDGLDEVKKEDDKRVVREIRKFTKKYDANFFVITCRIAAKEYIFEDFTDVEMADFDDEQIQAFVTKWFQTKNPTKSKQFIGKLKQNNRIKELATNPLLLTFLCLLFSDSVDFPANRVELYEDGLDILLKKWDGKRGIERDINPILKKLNSKQKKSLLSKIAFTTFQSETYLFKQSQAEEYISRYIEDLPDIDLKAIQIESELVLQSIESHYGLLMQRARKIYSFSHLTFHEYFTASYIYINRDQELENLTKHITEPRWREVILLTGGMLEKADELMLLMKHKIDELLANDEKLQDYLTWVEQKSSSVKVFYKPAAVRAFYLECDLFLFLHLSRSLDIDRSTDRLLGLDLKRTMLLDLDRCFYRYMSIFRSEKFRAFDNASSLFFFSLLLDEYPELKQKLQELEQELEEKQTNTNNKNCDNLQRWVETDGQAWIEKLRAVMIQHRNIGHDWQFTENQKKLLNKYYDANCLLVECLKECHLTRAVREEIENTLLLPVQRN